MIRFLNILKFLTVICPIIHISETINGYYIQQPQHIMYRKFPNNYIWFRHATSLVLILMTLPMLLSKHIDTNYNLTIHFIQLRNRRVLKR